MDTPIEKFDVHNIIEVQRMRTLLVKHPDLLTLFDSSEATTAFIDLLKVKIFVYFLESENRVVGGSIKGTL